ncbi:Hypothetical predicted protein [Marmota monax]|uniref:Protein ripply2 n=1 Tax=Marmota monax TaxID=9995 RepID=A0A5E4AXX2_MARMO|nr:Hypothetical predicted protein [Marmota monax]
METAESAESAENAESAACERARRHRLLPAVPDVRTRRGAADSGRSAVFWRPWVKARGEKEEGTLHYAAETIPNGPGMIQASGKLFQYTHPVRLFWPKSKCYDYLYQEAEALLKIFPIQATISFYEDSDSEDEIEQLTCEN